MGKMLSGQGGRITHVNELLHDSCCETVDKLHLKMKNWDERERESQVSSDCKVFADGWLDDS